MQPPRSVSLSSPPAAWRSRSKSQQTLVSPAAAATVPGSTNNVAPFGQAMARRYIQIHSDLGTGVKFFKQLSLRKKATTALTGTITTDVEVNMGNSVPWDQIRFLMSANFTGPKTRVIARKNVVLGPSPGTGNPPPFDLPLVLDAPYLHIGTSSLAWEALVYSNTISGTAPTTLDADTGSRPSARPRSRAAAVSRAARRRRCSTR